MGSRNYLINTRDLTLTDKKAYKTAALAAGIERCSRKSIGNPYSDIPTLQSIPEAQYNNRVRTIADYISKGNWPASIDARELVTGPARSDLTVATALDAMRTAALALVGTWYSCFQAVAAPQLVAGKLLVVYGISVNTVPIPVSHIQFLRGTNVQGLFDLQTQETMLEFDAFLSEPIVFDPQDVFAVQVLASVATGAAAQVHLHNFLFENSGDVIA
jgi:hypothetical protein